MLNRRYISTSFDVLLSNLKRYKFLTESDKRVLLTQHSLEDVTKDQLSKINEALDLKVSNTTSNVSKDSLDLIQKELERIKNKSFNIKRLTLKDINKKPDKFNMGIDYTKELQPFEIQSSLFSKETETLSLVNDVKKANRFMVVKEILSENRPIPNHIITDRFIDVMSRAIELNISNLERPILINELSEYNNSYSLKKATLRNLLRNLCTRNAFEETRIEKVLDSINDLRAHKFNISIPPEVVEPLLSFHGDVMYHHCPLKRLEQKLSNVNKILNYIIKNTKEYDSRFLPEVTASVPLAMEATPPEVNPAVSSSNYLSLKSRATPGDRGGGEGSDVTSSGKPVADLREAEGEVNKRAATASGRGEYGDVTSGGLPEADLREAEGEVNKRSCLQDKNRTSGGRKGILTCNIKYFDNPLFLDNISSNYPFGNFYSFESSIPNDVTGSIKMGRRNDVRYERYPNLQCVAHSLPKDGRYRAILIHAIRILERSKGWDQLSKVKAINRLVQVYNNIAPYDYYSKVLNDSIPIRKVRGNVIKTQSRSSVFNKGLKYIPSLFHNHWNRIKKK